MPFKVPEDLSEGNRLSVMCAVTSGTPPISFVWHKDGKPVGDLDGVRIAHMDDFQDVLQIEKLTVDHVGNYTCNAKNMYGADHISVPVVLKFAPRWLRSASEKLSAGFGDVLIVDCAVAGHPVPTLRVFHSEFVRDAPCVASSRTIGVNHVIEVCTTAPILFKAIEKCHRARESLSRKECSRSAVFRLVMTATTGARRKMLSEKPLETSQ